MSFLNHLISGISLGSIYAIIALGYNGALKELQDDGTVQSIVDKYISADSAAQ